VVVGALVSHPEVPTHLSAKRSVTVRGMRLVRFHGRYLAWCSEPVAPPGTSTIPVVGCARGGAGGDCRGNCVA
jgi:hypothetical protein